MSRVLLGLAAIFLMVLIGCIPAPDANSGDDGHRHTAVELPLEEPIPDDFSWPKGDRTDWKVFQLPSDSLLIVNVHFTNADAVARVELYDTYGRPIAKRIKESGRDEHLQFSEALRKGRYFLRIMADDEGDASEYTVVLNLGD